MTDSFIKLAMGQMLVEGGAPETNLSRAESMIADAAAQGCRGIVLPECLDLGWTHACVPQRAEPIPGPRSERLAAAARQAGIFVTAGLTERAEDHIYNAAVLIDPDGRIVLKHRKITVLDIARHVYAIGDRLAVADTDIGRVGLNICADNWPRCLHIGRSLGAMGAKLLVSPSAWAVPADHDNDREPYGQEWHDSYSTLAKEFGMTVVGVSNVGPIAGGPWDGRKCIGRSLAVGPDGQVLALGPYGISAETLLTVEVPILPTD